MKRRKKPPVGCTHTPPCPHRRACKKYHWLSDRFAARLLMGLDDLLAGLRQWREAVLTVGCADLSQLTVEQQAERTAQLMKFRAVLLVILQAADEGADIIEGTPESYLPTLH